MALEIRTSLRPERPGTTPEGNVRQRESREREGEREQKTGRNETGKRSEGAKAKDTEGQTHPTQKHTKEREKERSINGGDKVVTPLVKICRRLWGLSKVKRGASTKKQLAERH